MTHQLQNISRAEKPTQQGYASSYIARHIHFDRSTENTLQQALDILSGPDRVSVGLLVRRALALYGASLRDNPGKVEGEREAVRRGARISRVVKQSKE